MRYIVGIDEAGRGPIAGPVAVGAVMVPVSFDTSVFAGVRDSKQLPQHKREAWLETLMQYQKQGSVALAVSFATQQYIDTHGIAPATRRAVQRVLRQLKAEPERTRVLLDGALSAPSVFTDQHTIPGGDRREPLISLAAIAAKVRRDGKMVAASKRFPQYGFEHHKGYGTSEHYRCIQQHGVCAFHRKTFIHLTNGKKAV